MSKDKKMYGILDTNIGDLFPTEEDCKKLREQLEKSQIEFHKHIKLHQEMMFKEFRERERKELIKQELNKLPLYQTLIDIDDIDE